MFASFTAIIALAASAVSAYPSSQAGTASVTPHEQYSSSIGALGCMINTNRVAYWPGSVDCDNICVQLSYGGRNIYVLKIDSSAGAHDISYDAWNYLYTGKKASEDPVSGGGVNMQYKYVHASKCKNLMHGGKLPLTASNSMNYVASCLEQPNSWVAKNHVLYNIMDPLCKWGVKERCSLNLAVSNQPSCPSGLGSNVALKMPVMNVAYGTGKVYQAA